MKIRSIIFVWVTLLSIASCTINFSDKNDMSGAEYTSAFVCPMYCEGSGSNEPGSCPTCNMDYVKNENINSKQ